MSAHPGYRLLLASDVSDRDGIGLELNRDDGTRLAEVFRDDISNRRVVNLFEANVPLELVTWLIESAEQRL
jgi:hypothetical protein